MKYNTLDILHKLKIKKIPIPIDLSDTGFELAVEEIGLIDDNFILYVPTEGFLEALKVVSYYLTLVDSNKKTKDLIRILKNADYDDWMLEVGDSILICPGA